MYVIFFGYVYFHISDHAIREREKWNERLDKVWQEQQGTFLIPCS
jgi:hypothetical protein